MIKEDELNVNDKFRLDFTICQEDVYLRVIGPGVSFNLGSLFNYYFGCSEALSGHTYLEIYLNHDSQYLYDKGEPIVFLECSRSKAKSLIKSLNVIKDSHKPSQLPPIKRSAI